MKILALDSTAGTASAAICDDRKLIAEFTVNAKNTHSENLLPMIEAMLKAASLKVSDIDIFVCSAGPGSFTGVRIGAATIKGLAFDSGKPCVGVSSLEALACNLRGNTVCPVMNARRGQVYNAVFDAEGKRLCEDRAVSAEELAAWLKNIYNDVYLCGDGIDVVLPALEGMNNIKVAPERLIYQSGYSVAVCGYEAYLRGEAVTDSELAPTYLRLPQAERERNARINKE